MTTAAARTNVYVDGFNLYYGALKGSPHKWLDLAALIQLIFPRNAINRIRYFTALVSARATDPGAPVRQQTYLRALQTIPGLSIHYGQFLTHSVRMQLVNPQPGRRTALVWKTEEKGTDVALATHLLADAFRNDYETAIVISNDSDLVPTIQIVTRELGKTVGVLNPHPRPSVALRREATFWRQLRGGPLGASEFPTTISDANGRLVKPARW